LPSPLNCHVHSGGVNAVWRPRFCMHALYGRGGITCRPVERTLLLTCPARPPAKVLLLPVLR
jgi:hypothetical protein